MCTAAEDLSLGFLLPPALSGLPVVIVGITLATTFDRYVADDHCWLNVQTDVIWAFVGPVLLVLLVSGEGYQLAPMGGGCGG